MDRGAWQAAVHRVAKSQTRLSDFAFFLAVLMEPGSDVLLSSAVTVRSESLFSLRITEGDFTCLTIVLLGCID